MRVRILIADDHELSRIGIMDVLCGTSRWDICGEAIDGRDAIEKVRTLKPDVVVMDAHMPGTTGIEGARRIRKIAPSTKIIIISGHDPTAISQLAMVVGADAFLAKADCGKRLNQTIANVLESRRELPPRR
jgi:DNA-binding NarL/FixJ family response regulator